MRLSEYVGMFAEGMCAACNVRAERDGEWACCPKCGKRWQFESDGNGFDGNFILQFDTGRVVSR